MSVAMSHVKRVWKLDTLLHNKLESSLYQGPVRNHRKTVSVNQSYIAWYAFCLPNSSTVESVSLKEVLSLSSGSELGDLPSFVARIHSPPFCRM